MPLEMPGTRIAAGADRRRHRRRARCGDRQQDEPLDPAPASRSPRRDGEQGSATGFGLVSAWSPQRSDAQSGGTVKGDRERNDREMHL